jgi:Bacterial protein of unknown function (DUF853)
MADLLLIAQSTEPLYLLPRMANRHGLVAGATGTGKTVTLQVMAESFSRIGVPVFAADVKGDLSGISQPGTENPKLTERVLFCLGTCPVAPQPRKTIGALVFRFQKTQSSQAINPAIWGPTMLDAYDPVLLSCFSLIQKHRTVHTFDFSSLAT